MNDVRALRQPGLIHAVIGSLKYADLSFSPYMLFPHLVFDLTNRDRIPTTRHDVTASTIEILTFSRQESL